MDLASSNAYRDLKATENIDSSVTYKNVQPPDKKLIKTNNTTGTELTRIFRFVLFFVSPYPTTTTRTTSRTSRTTSRTTSTTRRVVLVILPVVLLVLEVVMVVLVG